MKRLPVLERFLSLVTKPKIDLYNHPIAWKSSEDDYETNYDNETSISYNGYINKSWYAKFLYKVKEAVIAEIKVTVNSQSTNEAKQSIANLLNSLDEPNKIQINHKYKLKEFDPEWKDAIELYGKNIVLKDYNMIDIKEFDEIGRKYYREIYEFFDKLYDHLHQTNTLSPFHELKSPLTSNGFITTFIINNKIFDYLYPKIFLLLNNKLFETNQETFIKAFSAESINMPLKIKWRIRNDNNSNQTGFRALFYFLKSELFDQEEDDKVFLIKVNMVFANADGSSFDPKKLNENHRQYIQDMGKILQSDRKWKSQIDRLVKLLLI